MTTVTTASRAYLSLTSVGAEEFKSVAELGTHLKDLAKIQKDHSLTLWDARPTVIPSGEGYKTWGLRSRIDGKQYGYRDHAYDQLCQRIGFPADTLAKCPPDLAELNVNYFSALKATDGMLFRTEGDQIRAVLSKDYRAVNHLELVESFLRSEFNWDVDYAGLTSKRMFMLATEPDSKFDGPDGSRLSRCTFVGNSETGEGGFFAQDLWYDYICSNRMIWGARIRGGAFHKVHKGDVRENLKRLMDWIGADRYAAADDARKAFTAAASDDFGRDDEKIVDYLSGRGVLKGIAKQALAYIDERWGEGARRTRFRTIAGLTYAAQSFAPDRRYEVERQAGDLIGA